MTRNLVRGCRCPAGTGAERDLRNFLYWAADEFATPEARALLPDLLVVLAGDDRLQEKLRDGFILPEFFRARRAVREAIDRGELRSNLDVDLILDALIGAVVWRSLLRDDPTDDRLVDKLIEIVLVGARPQDDPRPVGLKAQGDAQSA